MVIVNIALKIVIDNLATDGDTNVNELIYVGVIRQ